MKKLLFLLLLVLAAYFFWRWWRSEAEVARGQELFYDRMWIDHAPRSETDTFQLFVAVTEQPIGVFQSASQWKGEYELFRYRAGGDGQMVVTYPQSGREEKTTYRASRCSEKSFDFCLDISGASRGVKRYYSRTGWEVGQRSLDETRREAAHLLTSAAAPR